MNLLGTPPIARYAYATGKLAFLLCCVAIVARRWWTRLTWLDHPVLDLLGALALSAGLIVAIVGLVTLGGSTRMGLPTEQTALKTQGIYQFSRNPIYTGAYLICLAAVLWTMNPVVFVLAAIVVVVHHKIVLAEERYLTGQFGGAYTDYARRVRRYL